MDGAPAEYWCELEGLPKKLIPTGMPAGEQAEEVARVTYLVSCGVSSRKDLRPAIVLAK